MKGSGKVFDKRKGKYEGMFIKLPSDLKHYVYLDGYKSEMSYLYCLIVDYYNADLGYAFPSQSTLARDYGKTEATTRSHLEMLREIGLISIIETSTGNHYVPYEPLQPDEFFAESPKAWENYKEKLAQIEREKMKSRERMNQWRVKNGIPPVTGDQLH